jgi:hypothetical protein
MIQQRGGRHKEGTSSRTHPLEIEVKIMKKTLFAPLLVIGSLALSVPAFAADKASGEIKSVDAAKHQLILADGKTFRVSKKVDLKQFKAGQTVNVDYTTKKGAMVASAVTVKQ